MNDAAAASRSLVGEQGPALDQQERRAGPGLVHGHQRQGRTHRGERLVGVVVGDESTCLEDEHLGSGEVVGRFDRCRQVADGVPVAGVVRRPGCREGETWSRRSARGRQLIHPVPQRLSPSLADEDPSLVLDDARRPGRCHRRRAGGARRHRCGRWRAASRRRPGAGGADRRRGGEASRRTGGDSGTSGAADRAGMTNRLRRSSSSRICCPSAAAGDGVAQRCATGARGWRCRPGTPGADRTDEVMTSSRK